MKDRNGGYWMRVGTGVMVLLATVVYAQQEEEAGDPELNRLKADVEFKMQEFETLCEPFEKTISDLEKLPPIERLTAFRDYIQVAAPLYEAGETMLQNRSKIERQILKVNTAHLRVAEHYREMAQRLEQKRKTMLEDQWLKADDKEAFGERLTGMIEIYGKAEGKWRTRAEEAQKFITEAEVQYQFKLLAYEVDLIHESIELARKMATEFDGADWYDKLQRYHQQFRRLMELFDILQNKLLEETDKKKQKPGPTSFYYPQTRFRSGT